MKILIDILDDINRNYKYLDDFCYYGAELIAFFDDDIYEDYGHLIVNEPAYGSDMGTFELKNHSAVFKFDKEKKIVYDSVSDTEMNFETFVSLYGKAVIEEK